jgi:hypothetical protein
MTTCDEHTRARATALLFLGTFFIGWADGVAQIMCGIDIADQKDIGVACGMMGTIRASFGAGCAAIYSTILTNELSSKVPGQVIPAILDAGLPKGSATQFLQALTSGNVTMLQEVKGVTATIIQDGSSALKQASADSYQVVFFSSIAFSVLAFVCAFFTADVDKYLTNTVSAMVGRAKPIVEEVEMVMGPKSDF